MPLATQIFNVAPPFAPNCEFFSPEPLQIYK
jgi:hypothetical protein